MTFVVIGALRVIELLINEQLIKIQKRHTNINLSEKTRVCDHVTLKLFPSAVC